MKERVEAQLSPALCLVRELSKTLTESAFCRLATRPVGAKRPASLPGIRFKGSLSRTAEQKQRSRGAGLVTGISRTPARPHPLAASTRTASSRTLFVRALPIDGGSRALLAAGRAAGRRSPLRRQCWW